MLRPGPADLRMVYLIVHRISIPLIEILQPPHKADYMLGESMAGRRRARWRQALLHHVPLSDMPHADGHEDTPDEGERHDQFPNQMPGLEVTVPTCFIKMHPFGFARRGNRVQ